MVSLTKRQQAVLIGTLLGDGCLEINGKNVRLKVDHTFLQKQLTDWMFQEFKGFSSKNPFEISQYDSRTGKVYYHYRFQTLSNPIFNEFYSMFYLDKRKIVPTNIKNLLIDPLSLAVWYMDDGFRRRDCFGAYLCTSAFTAQEQILLIETLRMNFEIDAKVHYAAGNARIYIPAKFAVKFCDIIRKFVLTDLSYKLFDPVTTCGSKFDP